MRVFVTGGNGFIGSVVVRALIASGHKTVCLVRDTSRTDRIDDLPFERARGDVRDPASVRAAMRGCDATIHLAAPGGWDADDGALLETVIVGGARHVLSAASELVGHRVVVVSSTAAIDASDTPRVFDEAAAFSLRDPSLVYAHAKHRAECVALEAHARGLPVVIVNPAEVYGPRDSALTTAGNLVDFATAWPVLVCDGGTNIVHVDDVAVGIIAALERGRPGERYILGGDNLTVKQLADLTLELLGQKKPVVTVPNRVIDLVARVGLRLHLPLPFNAHVIPYATKYWFMSSKKAQRELGVRFRSARETLAPTLDWLKQSGHIA